MGVLYQFNGYNYQTKGVVFEHPEQVDAKERLGDTPGRDGGYTMSEIGSVSAYIEDGLLAARRITLSGQLIPAAGDVLTTLWDAFKAKHLPGQRWSLYVGDDTRQLQAEVVGISDADAKNYPNSIPWQVRFLAADPLWRAVNASSTNITVGTTAINSVAGNYPSPPTITLPISGVSGGGAGQSLTLTLTNGTFSKVMTVSAPATNTTLTIDVVRERITDGGGNDVTYLMSGVWFKLQPMNQNLVIAQSGGLTLASANIAWNDRYL